MLKQRVFEGRIKVAGNLDLENESVKLDGESWDGQVNEKFLNCGAEYVIAKILQDQKWASGSKFRITIEPIAE